MCRRCGEPDKRGNNTDRARRKQWLLNTYGDGRTVPCWLCDRELTVFTVESDRIIPGGSYARSNVKPCCGPCNRSRADIEEGCAYG